MTVKRIIRSFCSSLICIVFFGCADLAKARMAAQNVEREFGGHAGVNVREINGTTNVVVTLDHLPPGEPASVKARIAGIVTRELPEAKQVAVVFRL